MRRAREFVAGESRFVDGNRTPGQENFVFVRHADSTFGRYYHLTPNGALVKVGQLVQAAELIATITGLLCTR